jgi:hypothetical protein
MVILKIVALYVWWSKFLKMKALNSDHNYKFSLSYPVARNTVNGLTDPRRKKNI